LPLLLLMPIRVLAALSANRRMNAYFQKHGIGSGFIGPSNELAGFVFTTHDSGTKQFTVKLLSAAEVKDFAFALPIPGLVWTTATSVLTHSARRRKW
jgi:hypothetical protein